MKNDAIKCILFDLGKVLIKLDGKNAARSWFPNYTPEEMYKEWMALNSIQNFEKGRITLDEFLIQAPLDLGIQMSSHDFHELYKSWLVGEFPGTSKLLNELKPRYKLGCLSNTNSIHADKLRKTGFLDHFDSVYLSHEIGIMKPDPRAYLHVIEDWSVSANEILFIDDRPDNVEAAKTLGMEAYTAEGIEAVKGVLQKYL